MRRSHLLLATVCVALTVAAILPAAALASWVRQASGTVRPLNAVSFVDDSNGWVVGGIGSVASVRHTANGGLTWRGQVTGVHRALNSVCFIDRLHGWAVGEHGTIVRTTDGGTTWHKQTSGTTKPLFTVFFKDAHYGWTGGDSGALSTGGVLLRTTNGGKTWAKTPLAGRSGPNAIVFVDRLHGWLATVGKLAVPSVVLHTHNGGKTWQQVWSYSGSDIDQITLAGSAAGSASHGWIVGGYYSSMSAIGGEILLKTVDGGRNWESYLFATNQRMNAVAALGSLKAWAVGSAGKTMHTFNGGTGWATPASGTKRALMGVDFVDAHHGWACGVHGVLLRWK
jgi:photosystem II stability/assembly factor-like uncharacterized protein